MPGSQASLNCTGNRAHDRSQHRSRRLGTLGTQVAIQAAAYGHRVSGFDPDGTAFQRMQTKVREATRMTRRGPTFPIEEWEPHAAKVDVHQDLAGALREADLVIEFVREDVAIKRAVFAELDRLAPRETVLATNSSTMPVSRMESATTRPGRCVNIHFYQPGIGMNMADVMGGTSTTPETLAAAREYERFAERLRSVIDAAQGARINAALAPIVVASMN